MTGHNPQPTTRNPPPLMTGEPGSFARATIVERKPEIIRRVIADNAYPPEIVAALEAFRDEIAHHPITPLTEDAPDTAFWNAHQAQYAGKTWLEVSWYFAETYFYRRLLEATRYFQPDPWQGHDPFAKQKRAQEAAAIAQLATVWAQIEALPPGERSVLLLHSALWGNRADLSNFTIRESAHRGLDAHTERDNLLIDDTEEVLAFFSQRTHTCWGRSPTVPPNAMRMPARSESGQSEKQIDTIAFINDNVGADSLFDLALADFLLTHGWTRNVVFYLKNQPFFVSDAMPEDIRLVIQQLESAKEPIVAKLGKRLHNHRITHHLSLSTDPFWTSCLSFWELPPALRDDLARADLIILKGDVNYRRLLDDRHWPHTTPIAHADAGFPRPYLLLRTLKGEIMVGLQPGQAETLAAIELDWLINGKRGVVQFVKD
ncbi:MAG: damage-control phosphatase ARMT1 family protein [Anaerolineae bacterium]